MFEQIGTVLGRVLEEQRARVPVRRQSYLCGWCESVFWRKTSRQEVRRILLAAIRYELLLRRKGRRCGPLGSVAIEVLEYFANLVDVRTGRLEPSIDTLMRRLRRSRDAIVRALKNLRTHGSSTSSDATPRQATKGAARRCGRPATPIACIFPNGRNGISTHRDFPSRFPRTANTPASFVRRNWSSTKHRFPARAQTCPVLRTTG